MTTPAPETTAPEPRRPGRLGWRRVIFGGLLGLLGGFGLVHVLGGEMTALIAGGSATAGAVGYGAYKYPHIRRHYEGPWLARKHARREGKGQKGFSEAWKRNWHKSWKSPGSPFRNMKNPFRRHSGPGGGRRHGAGLRNGRGRGMLRLPGANRRARAGSGSRSRHSGAGTGRRAGIFRRSGRGTGASRRSPPGSGRSRRLSGAFGRLRRHPGGTGRRPPSGRTRRRTPLHPFGGRRTTPRPGHARPRSIRHPRGGRRTPPRPARPGHARPRSIRHPFGGRRTTPRPPRTRPRSIRHPFGGPRAGGRRTPAGRTRPRSILHPWGGRRFWRPGTPHRPRRLSRIRSRIRSGRPGRGIRRGWHKVSGTPSSPRLARRAWHKVFGTPAARAARRRAARARRANARNRRRRAAGTYGRRPRWYAPWRSRTGSAGTPHWWPSWRRNAAGRRLSLRQRLARRRGIHRGLSRITGRTPFRLRMRHWRARMRGWSPRRWWRNRRRNRRMPRPLLSGRYRSGPQSAALHRFGRTRLGRWIMRRDRRRRQVWQARQARGRAVPVPDTGRRPVTPAAAGGNGHRPGRNTTGGGGPVDVRGMADQIRETATQEFASPNNVHDVLTSMHSVIAATQGSLSRIGEQVDGQPGVIRDYGEAIREAAASMGGTADALEQAAGAGITGRGATGSGLHDVAEEITAMGGQEFHDSDDVHNTLIDLHSLIEATQESMYHLGHKISELPGVVPEYSEAAFAASGSLQGIAETLQAKAGLGITGQGAV